MRRFKDYTIFCTNLKASRALKEQVLNTYCCISNKSGNTYRPVFRRYKRKIVLAAVLLLAFLATACTLAMSYGLIDRLVRRGLGDADTLESLTTTSAGDTESSYSQKTDFLAVAEDDWAQYSVLEAICDYNSIYIHFQVVPLDGDTIFIYQTLNPDGPAQELGIPGLSDDTVKEYAQSQGKTLRYANIYLSQDNGIMYDFGVTAETAPDGSLHIYGSCQNFSSEEELSLSCTAYTYPADWHTVIPAENRTELKVTLHNKSSMSAMIYTHFEPEIQDKFGITIESLLIEKTELGYYCTFTYRGEKAERTLFSMVDENGEYFPVGGPRGSEGSTMNSDGSYSLTDGIPIVESPEKLMFMLVDENHDKHGPYNFSP